MKILFLGFGIFLAVFAIISNNIENGSFLIGFSSGMLVVAGLIGYWTENWIKDD